MTSSFFLIKKKKKTIKRQKIEHITTLMTEESILLEEFPQYYGTLQSVAWQEVEKERQRLFFLPWEDQAKHRCQCFRS